MTRLGYVGIVMTIVGATACGKSHERERVDFERMRVQQRVDPYGTSRGFADGKSMQSPPTGTISREAAAAPVGIASASVERGADRFGIYCAVCHGVGGFGGSIVASNMGVPRPPSLRSQMVRDQSDAYLFDVATRGKGRMPAYAPQLTPADRWAVVAYVRRLQATGATTPAERDDSLLASRIRELDSIAVAQRK
jgi:mono/diheme cytochrome c family protein